LVFCSLIRTTELSSKVLPFDNKNKKKPFCFVLCSLIRTSELRSYVLPFDNKNKKKPFCFVLCSLIRTFADEHQHYVQV
jgi:endogenous inhibitor of DNA gyrase (YacG/DUF329 family)